MHDFRLLSVVFFSGEKIAEFSVADQPESNTNNRLLLTSDVVGLLTSSQ